MPFATMRGHFAAVQRSMQWCETDLRLQEGFAMMRGEIARKRQISAAPQAIKNAGRRLFQ